ncbi:MAG: DUF255 domain-containing protein [Phycisphaeraceae bacterium]
MTRSADTTAKYTNALVHETSPYLLQHAHNPVDWYPWGEAAFEKARREDKPVFLSVGYSTCYWCHVMERQVFEDPAIAERMNARAVNIKVDREERPDVDEIYMTATQLMTGHGGWPMSVFLTPPRAKGNDDTGLKPFWAGTYIPPTPQHGMPGFPQVIDAIADAWQNRRNDVIEQADRIAEAVREQLRHRDTSGPLDADLVGRAASTLLHHYDAANGGFGEAPKFPQPANLLLLMAVWRNNSDDDLRAALAHTLDRMARGGIYDQVGGGFHRYSTDAEWLVPHFEKMLYDNGQLVETYAEAYATGLSDSDRALHARIVRETCDYVLREMTDTSGAFWSAQDAEVDGREGGNYIWTRQQVEDAIDDPDLAQLAVRMYGLDHGTNFRDPHHPDAEPANVLHLPRPLIDLAEETGQSVEALDEKRRQINAQLKTVRDRRKQPGTDEKILVEWNGMMIAGLARAARILDAPQYRDAAQRAVDAILQHMAGHGDGLYRTMRHGEAKIPAFLTDYAFFVHGLIELHHAAADETGDRYLDLARQYTQAAIDRFAVDADGSGNGGYYDTLADQGDLFVRVRSTHDGVIPSGNSQMVHNLLDLHELTGEPAYLERAARDLRSRGQILDRRGVALVHMQHALLRMLEKAPQMVETGQRAAAPPMEGPVAVEVEPRQVDLSSGEATLTVTLRIEAGYHINAAEPGAPDVVPTEIALRGGRGLALEVAYPDGESRAFPYAEQPLSVYEGETVLSATLRRSDGVTATGTPRLTLRYQACTDSACLAPQTVELPVEIAGLDGG